MLQHEQRDDVALVGQIRLRVDQAVERGAVPNAQLVELVEIVDRLDDDVAEMDLAAVHARHVPAAPAALQRRAVGDENPALVRNELAGRARIAGADDEARHAAARQRVRVVAAQAAPELGRELRFRRALLEQIEDGAELRIERRDLDRPVLHVTDVRVVVEVDRARRLRIDELALQARLRVHERLRRGIDLEIREQRFEIATLIVVLEHDLAALDSANQRGDAVRALPRRIGNRRVLLLVAKHLPRRRRGRRVADQRRLGRVGRRGATARAPQGNAGDGRNPDDAERENGAPCSDSTHAV